MTTDPSTRPARRTGDPPRPSAEPSPEPAEPARRLTELTGLSGLTELAPPIAATAAGAARGGRPVDEGGEEGLGTYAPATGDPHPDPLYEAVREALRGFPASLLQPGTVPASAMDAFQRLGEAEAKDGADAADLHATISVAAGIAVQQVIEQALRRGLALTPAEAGALARTSLAYLDRLRHAAAGGYTAAGTGPVSAGRSEHRERLIRTLLSRDCDMPRLTWVAAQAGWTLPRSLAVVVVDPRGLAGALPPFPPPDVLVATDLEVPCLIFPDPDGPGRRTALARLLADRPAVIGPTVDATRAAESLRLAHHGLRRLPAELIAARTPLLLAEHISTLILAQCPDLARSLVERRLAPLGGLRAAQRRRLAETLLTYLECGRNAPEAAARLHTHPQTVRYRVRQLNGLFGPDLDDPAHALDYLMALHAFLWRLYEPAAVRGDDRAALSADGDPAGPTRRADPSFDDPLEEI